MRKFPQANISLFESKKYLSWRTATSVCCKQPEINNKSTWCRRRWQHYNVHISFSLFESDMAFFKSVINFQMIWFGLSRTNDRIIIRQKHAQNLTDVKGIDTHPMNDNLPVAETSGCFYLTLFWEVFWRLFSSCFFCNGRCNSHGVRTDHSQCGIICSGVARFSNGVHANHSWCGIISTEPSGVRDGLIVDGVVISYHPVTYDDPGYMLLGLYWFIHSFRFFHSLFTYSPKFSKTLT